MALKKLGAQTIVFSNPPSIAGFGNAVGSKEGKGPLGKYFNEICQDNKFGEKSWEKSETSMQKKALSNALKNAGLTGKQMDIIFAGDLLNQCIASAFSARDQNIPFLGLYGACSTMAESLLMASLFLDGGFGSKAVAMTSSHFCSAERQYRLPLEYGGQRPPTAQWTATASGAVILSDTGTGPYVTHATIGKIVDKGITDANNMGAAMAPAAYETLRAHFSDTGHSPSYYDLIVTGDLGKLGKDILIDFFSVDGVDLSKNYEDCGLLLFDLEKQDVHAGGSGCGCSASVLTGYLLPEMIKGRWNRILFCATGALHSPISAMQGESIPAICHAISISVKKGAFHEPN